MGYLKNHFALFAIIIVASGAVVAVSGSCTPPSGAPGLPAMALTHETSNFGSGFFPFSKCFDHLTPDHFSNWTETRNGATDEMYRWPKGKMPYVIEDHVSDVDREQIQAGIRLLEASTCLRVPKRTTEPNYITIRTNDPRGGCFCDGVGMRGGPTILNLGPGCAIQATAAHELLHAAGLWHEHARPDRDQYIFVNYQNICLEKRSNLERCDEGSWLSVDGCDPYGEAYDVDSIMHYPGVVWDRTFAVNTSIAIMISKVEGHPIPNTLNSVITAHDAAKIQKMYKNCQ